MTAASFSSIRRKIQDSIDVSKESISVAVAWFTSKDLLGKLIDKLEDGCKVQVILSDHIENQRLSFTEFIESGGELYVLVTGQSKFLHEKFAVFDNTKIIAGSYNWTNSAEHYNHEFIIQSEDPQLVKQFCIRFQNLKQIGVAYDKKSFVASDCLMADTKEEEFLKLEEELQMRLRQAIDDSLRAGAKIDKHNILHQILRYGAIGAANRLIREGVEKLQSGLIKLYEVDRLDLTIEAIILQPKYRSLFSGDILEKAQQRLDKLKKIKT